MKYKAELLLAATKADPQTILERVLKLMVPGASLVSAVQAACKLWELRDILKAPTQTERSALIVKLCLEVAMTFA